MSRKKIILSSIIILAAAIIVLVLMYVKFWQEPKATYLETKNPKLVQIRKELNELKSELRKKGVYNCCIRNDCNWCAIYMGHCPCADLVFEKGNEKSCPDCAAAWNRKQGRFPSVDPDAIKVTTFGIYGYEKDGHHQPDSKGSKVETEDTHSDHTGGHHH